MARLRRTAVARQTTKNKPSDWAMPTICTRWVPFSGRSGTTIGGFAQIPK